MSIKDITIVITSFKSEKKIKNCLNSIDKHCEVINVENSDNQDYKKKVFQILKKYKPVGIFNLAAETHVDRSIDQPINFINSNISSFSFLHFT